MAKQSPLDLPGRSRSTFEKSRQSQLKTLKNEMHHQEIDNNDEESFQKLRSKHELDENEWKKESWK